MIHIDRARWNIAPISPKWLLRHVRIEADSQRHPVMLSIASDLGVPIRNDARDFDLRLPAVSHARLPHAQHGRPLQTKRPPGRTPIPGDFLGVHVFCKAYLASRA